MNRRYPSLAKEIETAHKRMFSDDNTLITYKDLIGMKDVTLVRYNDLPETEIEGYPVASFRDENNELNVLMMPNCHEICVGTTGSGKTTGCVEPVINIISHKKNKPCLFIMDPKGELTQRCAKRLQRQGYKIFCMNWKDTCYSNSWNPLSEIYDTYMQLKDTLSAPVYHKSSKNIGDYQLVYASDTPDKHKGFWSVGNKAFTSEAYANRYITVVDAQIRTDTNDQVHQLVNTIIPDSRIASHDPTWELGAREILMGIIYVMLEDALDDNCDLTRESFNFMNMQRYYAIIRAEMTEDTSLTKQLIKTKKLKHKKFTDESIKHLKAYFENAASTSRSYMGVFENLMQDWFNTKMYTLCNGSDIDLSGYEDQPFAVFLSTRDYEKSDFIVAGLFIDWVYRKMLNTAEENGGTLKREMVFMLDEFGNIPEIVAFENKIATSRSRNIWFHMYIQSYAQISAVYDTSKSRSRIIMDNCNSHCFLGSQNYDTKCTFSKECGRRTVTPLTACLDPDNHQLSESPLVSISDLENLCPGDMYIRRLGLPLIKTRFERSYLCPEFAKNNNTMYAELCIYTVPYTDPIYEYKFLNNRLSLAEYITKKATDELDILDSFPFERKSS